MYLVPVDVWYIIPFDVVEGNLSLNLTPRKGHKFAQYMEGWNLLRGAEKKKAVKAAAACLPGEISLSRVEMSGNSRSLHFARCASLRSDDSALSTRGSLRAGSRLRSGDSALGRPEA